MNTHIINYIYITVISVCPPVEIHLSCVCVYCRSTYCSPNYNGPRGLIKLHRIICWQMARALPNLTSPYINKYINISTYCTYTNNVLSENWPQQKNYK